MDDRLQVSEWIMVFLVWREFWNGRCDVNLLLSFYLRFM